MVLDADAAARLRGAPGLMGDEGARGDLAACETGAAISLVLLFAQHASDRRGARPLLRGHAVPRVRCGRGLARYRSPDSGPGEPSADFVRRRALRTIDLLSPIHARDL